jgi:hypothetical protein
MLASNLGQEAGDRAASQRCHVCQPEAARRSAEKKLEPLQTIALPAPL